MKLLLIILNNTRKNYWLSVLLITFLLLIFYLPAIFSQEDSSLIIRRMNSESQKTLKRSILEASYPSSYGTPTVWNQYYEYIGDYSFQVDRNANKVSISIEVVITTGEEKHYPLPEYVNVWIDWNGNGTFDASEQVMNQQQYAKSVGFSGTLYYTSVVIYPKDVSIVDSTWIRAELGYGHDPKPIDSWTYGTAITEPIQLGQAKLEGLRVWISNSETALKSGNMPDESANAASSFYSGTISSGVTIDPYHGVLVQEGYVYGAKFMPLVYKANEEWNSGIKWNGKAINYDFFAKFPGDKLKLIVMLKQSAGEWGENGDVVIWSNTIEIINGNNIGQIPGEKIKNLAPGDYYISWKRIAPQSILESFGDWMPWNWRDIWLKFEFKIQRRPYYVCDKTTCEPEKEIEKHFKIDQQLYDQGMVVGTSIASAVVGTVATLVIYGSGPVTILPSLAIGFLSSAVVGEVGYKFPVVFDWVNGGIAYEYIWNMKKYAWTSGNYFYADINITWHRVNYYQLNSEKGIGYWWDSNLSSNIPNLSNKLDYSTGTGWIIKNKLDNFSEWSSLRFYNCYPNVISTDPNEGKLEGYGPVDPVIKLPSHADPGNILPVFYKDEETQQFLHVKPTGPLTYNIYAIVEDPDGIGIEETVWKCDAGKFTTTSQRQATWESPGDNKLHTITATVTDVHYNWQPHGSTSRYVVIEPPKLKSGIFAEEMQSPTKITKSLITNFFNFGIDKNANGKFDSLVITFDINISDIDKSGALGNYIISTCLKDSLGKVISSTQGQFKGKYTPQPIRLLFNGISIKKHGLSGPYRVHAFAVDKITSSGIEQIFFDSISFKTLAYKPENFESNYLSFEGTPSDEGVDLNNNIKFDLLKVQTNVQVGRAGKYSVQAKLFANDTINIGSATEILIVSSPGFQTAILNFDGIQISKTGRTGPYSVKDITITDMHHPEVFDKIPVYLTKVYSPADFVMPFASFTGNPTDSGIDYNNDGLYDTLKILIPIKVETSGEFSVIAELKDSIENVIEKLSYSVKLAKGSQVLAVPFSGKAIGNSKKNGPYYLKSLSIQNKYDEVVRLPDRFLTKLYQYASFQKAALILKNKYAEILEDNDKNDKFENLQIQFQVETITSGKYNFTGSIMASGDIIVAASQTEIKLAKGISEPLIKFKGQTIAVSGKNGPYKLSINAWDTLGNLVFEANKIFTTSALVASKFDAPITYFTQNLIETTIDKDKDTFFDTLQIKVELAIAKAGKFTIKAECIDTVGNIIQKTEASNTLAIGKQYFTLKFDGKEFFMNGKDGRYVLANVYLYQVEGNIWKSLDFEDVAFVTKKYKANQFQHSGAWLTSAFDDLGVDKNGNGLYDSLRINAGLEIKEAGSYKITGQLYDKNGYYIEAATINKYMSAGKIQVPFNFSGGRIRGHGDASPYQLKYIKLYNGSNKLMGNIDITYTTQTYKSDKFENSMADLALFSNDITLQKNSSADYLTIISTLYNFGGTKTDSVKVDVYDGSTKITSNYYLRNISGSHPVNTYTQWNIKDLSGSRTIKIKVDADYLVPEISETNNEVVVSTTLPITKFPEPPNAISVIANLDSVVISWDSFPTDINGYNIYRKKEGEAAFVKVNPFLLNVNSFVDTSVSRETSYSYVITSFRSGLPNLESDFSKETKVITQKTILNVNLYEYTASAESEFFLPIVMTNLKGSKINDIRFKFAFDPKIIECLGLFSDETKTENWGVPSYTLKPEGEIWAEMHGIEAISDTGIIAILKFKVVGSINQTSELRFKEFVINNGYPIIETQTGTLRINAPLLLETTVSIPNISLSQNYPNPFHYNTTICYEIPGTYSGMDVILAIFDLKMVKVRELIYKRQSSGKYEITWDGTDENGNELPAGLYIYRIKVNSSVIYKKMLLLK